MQYGIDHFCIPSVWFEGNNNLFKNIQQEKGLLLYFALFKFRLHSTNYDEHKFITSLYDLRKELGWSKKKTYDVLLLLKTNKVIFISDYEWKLLRQNNINDRLCLHVDAIDVPDKKEDYYIHIPTSIIEEYQKLNLSEACLPFYCLGVKWSHRDDGFYMSVDTIGNILGYGRKTIMKSIVELNRTELMFTVKDKNSIGRNIFRHYIVKEKKYQQQIKNIYGRQAKEFLAEYGEKYK